MYEIVRIIERKGQWNGKGLAFGLFSNKATSKHRYARADAALCETETGDDKRTLGKDVSISTQAAVEVDARQETGSER